MNITETLTVEAKIKAIPGVYSAKRWTKGDRDRVYFVLAHRQTGWERGAGRRAGLTNAFIDLITGEIHYNPSDWGGAATANWHEENDTFAKIEAATKI